MNQDMLERLWQSTEALPKRFDLAVEIDAQMRKVHEEVYEFTREVHHWEHDEDTRLLDMGMDAASEAVDVIVTMMMVLQQMGVSQSLFAEMVQMVAEKNDAKTTSTHEVRNGMIARKPNPVA